MVTNSNSIHLTYDPAKAIVIVSHVVGACLRHRKWGEQGVLRNGQNQG